MWHAFSAWGMGGAPGMAGSGWRQGGVRLMGQAACRTRRAPLAAALHPLMPPTHHPTCAGGPRPASVRLRRLHRQAVEHQVAVVGGAGALAALRCAARQSAAQRGIPSLRRCALPPPLRNIPRRPLPCLLPTAHSNPGPTNRWTPRPMCARCAGAPAPPTSWQSGRRTMQLTCTTCATPRCRCAPSRATGAQGRGCRGFVCAAPGCAVAGPPVCLVLAR